MIYVTPVTNTETRKYKESNELNNKYNNKSTRNSISFKELLEDLKLEQREQM